VKEMIAQANQKKNEPQPEPVKPKPIAI